METDCTEVHQEHKGMKKRRRKTVLEIADKIVCIEPSQRQQKEKRRPLIMQKLQRRTNKRELERQGEEEQW